MYQRIARVSKNKLRRKMLFVEAFAFYIILLSILSVIQVKIAFQSGDMFVTHDISTLKVLHRNEFQKQCTRVILYCDKVTKYPNGKLRSTIRYENECVARMKCECDWLFISSVINWTLHQTMGINAAIGEYENSLEINIIVS